MADITYRADASRVVSEMLDGEAIIIDFKDGFYYSLNNTGSVLWVGIQNSYTREQLLKHFKDRYDASSETIEKSLDAILEQLKGLSLISEVPVESAPEVEPYTGEREKFFMPALQQFQDMQEMLLADPVHDIDIQTGWPTLKPQG